MSAVEIMGNEATPAAAGALPWLDLANNKLVGTGGLSRALSHTHSRILAALTATPNGATDGTIFRAIWGSNMDRWPADPIKNLQVQVSSLRGFLRSLNIPAEVRRVVGGYQLADAAEAPASRSRTRGPDKAPRQPRRADGNVSRSRHPNHEMGDPSLVLGLRPDSPAVLERRTLFPSTVVSAIDTPRLLVDGANQRKLGHQVVKGPWAGMPIYALTLEERATCPSSCHNWCTCMGNGMQFARRHRHGPGLEYRLADELSDLQEKHPAGFVVRLHVLGDFVDLAYAALWRRWMGQFPGLHVFGYTAWPYPAGTVSWRAGCAIDERQQLAALIDQMNLDFAGRWSIRFSTPRPFPGAHGQVTTINRRPEAAVVPEGIVCPAETGKTVNCGTCGLCWSPAAQHRPIVFVLHGRQVTGRRHISSAEPNHGVGDTDAIPSSAPAETAGSLVAGVSSQTSPTALFKPAPSADFSRSAAERLAANKAEAAKYRGVYAANRGYGFEARITLKGRRVKYLGYSSTAEGAARAFDEAARPLGRKLNFPDDVAVEATTTDTSAERAHPGQAADASHSDAETNRGAQAGRGESLGARPAVPTALVPPSSDESAGRKYAAFSFLAARMTLGEVEASYHPMLAAWECPVCHKFSPTPTALRKHLDKHHPITSSAAGGSVAPHDEEGRASASHEEPIAVTAEGCPPSRARDGRGEVTEDAGQGSAAQAGDLGLAVAGESPALSLFSAPTQVDAASPRTDNPPIRPVVPPTSKLATAEPAPLKRAAPPPTRTRAQEQAEIERFIAERGVVKLPPTGQPDSHKTIAAARAQLEGDAYIAPGTPVTYKAGAGRGRGVVDEEFSGDRDRIVVRVTEANGEVRKVRPLRDHVRICK